MTDRQLEMLTYQVLPSHHREENPPLVTLLGMTKGMLAKERRPYLEGVALHQRDVLLIYQCVLGLEINVSRRYIWNQYEVPTMSRSCPLRLSELSRRGAVYSESRWRCQSLVLPHS